MKIGAFVPQGWRMDLNGIPLESQWETIINCAQNIEKLNYESIWVYDHFILFRNLHKIQHMNAGH